MSGLKAINSRTVKGQPSCCPFQSGAEMDAKIRALRLLAALSMFCAGFAGAWGHGVFATIFFAPGLAAPFWRSRETLALTWARHTARGARLRIDARGTALVLCLVALAAPSQAAQTTKPSKACPKPPTGRSHEGRLNVQRFSDCPDGKASRHPSRTDRPGAEKICRPPQQLWVAITTLNRRLLGG